MTFLLTGASVSCCQEPCPPGLSFPQNEMEKNGVCATVHYGIAQNCQLVACGGHPGQLHILAVKEKVAIHF